MSAESENLDEKLDRFRSALELFLERLDKDKNILAGVLVGSLNEETIWRKEHLYLWLIEVDGVTKRLKADGDDADIYRWLCEEGINLHVQLIPRSRFRKMVEGTSRTSFSCNFFAKRELVHCKDPSIEKWFQKADTAATKDREKELLATTTWAIHAVRNAEKQLNVKQDLELAKQTLLWGAHSMAAMEIVRSGEIYEHEAIYRALEMDPELFQVVYVEVLTKKTKKVFSAALEAMTQYLEEHWEANLKPLTHFLRKHGGTVPLTELSEHFAYSQLHPWHLESACEWLESMGLVEKFSAPFKLTKKSRVDVEEPAYMMLD
jgi:hypothetical protein